jgi:hypothetical protein
MKQAKKSTISDDSRHALVLKRRECLGREAAEFFAEDSDVSRRERAEYQKASERSLFRD